MKPIGDAKTECSRRFNGNRAAIEAMAKARDRLVAGNLAAASEWLNSAATLTEVAKANFQRIISASD